MTRLECRSRITASYSPIDGRTVPRTVFLSVSYLTGPDVADIDRPFLVWFERMEVAIQQVRGDVDGMIAVPLASENLIHWIKFCSRLTLNFCVLSTMIRFSRISRPTRR